MKNLILMVSFAFSSLSHAGTQFYYDPAAAMTPFELTATTNGTGRIVTTQGAAALNWAQNGDAMEIVLDPAASLSNIQYPAKHINGVDQQVEATYTLRKIKITENSSTDRAVQNSYDVSYTYWDSTTGINVAVNESEDITSIGIAMVPDFAKNEIDVIAGDILTLPVTVANAGSVYTQVLVELKAGGKGQILKAEDSVTAKTFTWELSPDKRILKVAYDNGVTVQYGAAERRGLSLMAFGKAVFPDGTELVVDGAMVVAQHISPYDLLDMMFSGHTYDSTFENATEKSHFVFAANHTAELTSETPVSSAMVMTWNIDGGGNLVLSSYVKNDGGVFRSVTNIAELNECVATPADCKVSVERSLQPLRIQGGAFAFLRKYTYTDPNGSDLQTSYYATQFLDFVR